MEGRKVSAGRGPQQSGKDLPLDVNKAPALGLHTIQPLGPASVRPSTGGFCITPPKYWVSSTPSTMSTVRRGGMQHGQGRCLQHTAVPALEFSQWHALGLPRRTIRVVI